MCIEDTVDHKLLSSSFMESSNNGTMESSSCFLRALGAHFKEQYSDCAYHRHIFKDNFPFLKVPKNCFGERFFLNGVLVRLHE